jgi:hypothetical protein
MVNKKREYNKICECCGEEFVAKRSIAKYCSNKCKTRVYAERSKNTIKCAADESKIKISEYFLTRGDICKNLSSGVLAISG